MSVKVIKNFIYTMNNTPKLNFPRINLRATEENGHTLVFDRVRSTYIVLTPEEWVRQHFVHLLIKHKGFPQALMANEVQLKLNGMSRRCDTVVYNRELKPRVIVEYKAPTVNITQQVFDQICRYNMVLQVDYLIVSNGLAHYCCRIDYTTRSYTFLQEIPHYDQIK